MLATLALSAALYAPTQGELTLSNARPTYGILGAARKDADMPKLLPGDQICVSFDIENLKIGDDGKVQYSIGMEVADKIVSLPRNARDLPNERVEITVSVE